MDIQHFRLIVTRYKDQRIKISLETGTTILFELYMPVPELSEDVLLIREMVKRQVNSLIETMLLP